MPSSPTFGISSPIHATGSRRSRFTYRQFAQLASYSTSNPLRVIAHIDLDAFYAQCEMVRLGTPEDKPLAVQQWGGLIAVNYAARASGIGRHCNISEAKKLCPDLIAQHVPTWREGDTKWAYRDDASASIATDKVSLDPYRLESRKILAVVKQALPANLQKVEKASIDEVFLDLSAHVHSILLERFPELSAPPPYNDQTETLPLPSVAALDWQADALVDLEEEEESIDPDWDDVAILIGSEIVRAVRAQIRTELGYTCSAGIANNKMISKLGSAYKKPNCQTVVRNRAVSSFLSGFQISKIRNLGGKLGEQVTSEFQVDNVSDLLSIPLEQIKVKLGDETGLWLYNTMRGIDSSEVNSRTQIKSMLSAKSFRPTISTPEQALKWLRIFVADIYARLVEEGVLENKRRPRTVNLHHRQEMQTHSRQVPIPSGKALNEETLFDLAKALLGQIMTQGKVWPCSNLSLSVGGFEDGVKGNMGIGGFLVKGDEAASLRAAEMTRSASPDGRQGLGEKPSKKPRVEGQGIQKFFSTKSMVSDMNTTNEAEHSESGSGELKAAPNPTTATDIERQSLALPTANDWQETPVPDFFCSRCKSSLGDAESLQYHEDWHIAKDLQDEERVRPAFAERPPTSRSEIRKGPGASSKRARGNKLEQGQKRLKFG